MDEKDLRILMMVSAEGTTSPDVISDLTDIPKSTVHYRLDQLDSAGVTTGRMGDLDLEAVGISLTIISEVWAEYEEGYHERVGGELADVEGVNQVYFTMGDTDFVVISHLTGRSMVQRLIADFEAIDGVQRTSSKFVIETMKDEPRPLNDFAFETLRDALPD